MTDSQAASSGNDFSRPASKQSGGAQAGAATPINVLVVGSGGREHALAWKISQSPRAAEVFVAPGNAGTAVDATNVDIAQDDHKALIRFAHDQQVGLVVVGPEAPLAAGLVDEMQEAGLRVFGPTKAAAELEGSKVFCKNLLFLDVQTSLQHHKQHTMPMLKLWKKEMFHLWG